MEDYEGVITFIDSFGGTKTHTTPVCSTYEEALISCGQLAMLYPSFCIVEYGVQHNDEYTSAWKTADANIQLSVNFAKTTEATEMRLNLEKKWKELNNMHEKYDDYLYSAAPFPEFEIKVI